jgi:hypothetical protein
VQQVWPRPCRRTVLDASRRSLSSQDGGELDRTRTSRDDSLHYSSQGALCARKAFSKERLPDESIRRRIMALTVFGDPAGVWDDTLQFPQLPEVTQTLSYCQQTTPDPLCTNPRDEFPTDPLLFIDRLVAIWRDFDEAELNQAQKMAVAALLIELPRQAIPEQLGSLKDDLWHHRVRRWLLTPEHFWYGIDGSVEKAADDIATVYYGREALPEVAAMT